MAWLAVLVAYAGSRILYSELGLSLDARSLDYFWQYLDLEQLRQSPFEAVFYQHTQPPLYNLFLALGLAAPDPERFFHASAIGFGLVLHLGLYALMRRLGVRTWLAVAVAAAFALNPASILMELWVFYTYPVAALVVASAALLHRGIDTGRAAPLLGAFALMALVVLTRSLFHLAWMVAAVALAVTLSRHRLRTMSLALIPLALASSVYAKNWVVFGRPVASTWMGFSLSRLVTTKAPHDLLFDLREAGEVSELVHTYPWLPLNRYPASWRELPEGTPDVPVLTRATRSTGHPNFNHAAYVRIAQAFQDDAKVVFQRRPETWWQSTQRAWQTHYLPIHDYTFFGEERERGAPTMREIERVYERAAGAWAFVEWDWDRPLPPFSERPGWLFAFAQGLALIVAIAAALRRRQSRARRAVLLYAAMTIVFVAVVGNSLELGENQRFRFLSEPLSWALIAFAADRAIGAVSRRARRGFRALTVRATTAPISPQIGFDRRCNET